MQPIENKGETKEKPILVEKTTEGLLKTVQAIKQLNTTEDDNNWYDTQWLTGC